ncbi:MAG TPA: tRNA (adenosine(37)-N6)-threonylcarbamoyltransferase complex transferase subunit TsaD, partial [Gammaproteobacteria bacterium]
QELAAEVGGAVFYPRPEFCTDNAAMIAYVGWLRLSAGQHEPLSFTARPRWPMTELLSP